MKCPICDKVFEPAPEWRLPQKYCSTRCSRLMAETNRFGKRSKNSKQLPKGIRQKIQDWKFI